MKASDLMRRIATGRCATYQTDVLIVADMGTTRVSLNRGLVRPADGTAVYIAMAAVSGVEAIGQERVRAVWAVVAEAAARSGELSSFRRVGRTAFA
jgi:hypothetical protein